MLTRYWTGKDEASRKEWDASDVFLKSIGIMYVQNLISGLEEYTLEARFAGYDKEGPKVL